MSARGQWTGSAALGAALAGWMLLAQGVASSTAASPSSASSQVQALYFHRTQRCPTCQRISAYVEEAVRAGFPEEIRQQRVAMYLIDFQDPKNADYASSYKIAGPTLVAARIENGRVTAWKPMPKVWSLVGKKQEFLRYVQDGIRQYLEAN